MAGSQQDLDFGDAARLEAHLVRCGYSAVQAGLAALVLREGEKREIGEDVVTVLSISSRAAARLLRCSHRCVTKSALRLAGTAGANGVAWFRVVQVGAAKPPLYVIDAVAARSLATPAERLDELLPVGGADPVCTGVYQCVPVCTAPGVDHERRKHKTGVFSTTSTILYTSGTQRSAVVGSGTHRPADQIDRPWDKLKGGVTDAELVSIIAHADLEVLRKMYDVCVDRSWLCYDNDDQWLRFLTAAHHCATAKLRFGRIARLIAFNRGGLDVSKCAQRSDQWAGKMVGQVHRDPLLAGRLMEEPDGE